MAVRLQEQSRVLRPSLLIQWDVHMMCKGAVRSSLIRNQNLLFRNLIGQDRITFRCDSIKLRPNLAQWLEPRL